MKYRVGAQSAWLGLDFTDTPPMEVPLRFVLMAKHYASKIGLHLGER